MKSLLFALFFIGSLDINSHEFNPAHLVIKQLNDDLSYEAVWMYPYNNCLLYTSPSPRDISTARMPSCA